MASITLKSYSNCTDTGCVILAEVKRDYDADVKDEWKSLSILTPEGASITHTDFPSGKNTSGDVSISVSDLDTGLEYSIKIQLVVKSYRWGQIDTNYIPWSKTYYYIIVNGDREKYNSVEKACAAWVEAKNNGFTVQPFESEDDSNIVGNKGGYCYEVTETGTTPEPVYGWLYLQDTKVDNSITVFTHPKVFYFDSKGKYNAGSQWDISKGINSLLTNFYYFDIAATCWKRWYNKEKSTAATIFTKLNGDGSRSNLVGNLTATQLNNAYNYLGSDKKYESGDIISAAMFKGLEEIINSYPKND